MFWRSRRLKPQIGKEFRLPICNKTPRPLRLFIEVHCDEYEVPSGGGATLTLEAGYPHSLEIWEDQVTVWNEGYERAKVEIHAVEDANRAISPLEGTEK